MGVEEAAAAVVVVGEVVEGEVVVVEEVVEGEVVVEVEVQSFRSHPILSLVSHPSLKGWMQRR